MCPVVEVHILQNCGFNVEDIIGPNGQPEGRALVIIEKDTMESWRYPVSLDVAKIMGQKLMGLGSVEVPQNGHDVDNIIRQGKSRN